ncbi:MAG TPA: SDR family NAD(P)-dependent oxidoreductase [Thermoanaerobaculales bacterium]|nr:SDR family NAD(P)-dependent oxidoreductase [Thermoanaerobaculales bacterium]
MTQNNDEAVMLITGGSRGIGAATAQLAARGGWRVMLSYRDDRRAAGRQLRRAARRRGQLHLRLQLPEHHPDRH